MLPLDRAILLCVMIEKRKVDARWNIYNNIIDLVRPLKGIWFPAIITQLYIQFGVKVEKNEKKIKVGLVISAMALT